MNAMTAKDPLNTLARKSSSPHESLSLLGVCLDEDTWELLKAFAESAPLIQLRGNFNSYRVSESDSVMEWTGDPAPDICLIDFDKDRRSATLVAERIHSSAPETALFAISAQSQSDLIIQSMRSGCSEYLVKPIDREQMLNAVARVAGRRREKKETYKAQILAFVGAKGGCGVTTLVTQIGALLAKSHSRKTLIVDLHPDIGDAALYLRLTKYKYNSFELLENTDRLDAELLQSFVLQHSSGLDVIPAPEGTEPAHNIAPGAVEQTFDFLRMRYEFILVDLPPVLTEESLEVIHCCEQLYVVTVAEVAALRNVVRQLDYFSRKQVPHDCIQVVLNRHQKRAPITDEQIEKAIRRKIYRRVPNEYARVMKTIHGGDPIGQLSSSDVTRNLNEWARAIGSKQGSEEKKKEGLGILGLWNR
jgi:pilus assembly protein CpaE